MSTNPTLKDLMREHWVLARTLRSLEIHFDPTRCKGVWQCYEVCPVGCWTPDLETRVVRFSHAERCIACGACVKQCPENAIELKVKDAREN